MAVLKFVTVSSHVVLKPVTIFIARGLFWFWNVFRYKRTGARGEGVKADIRFGFVTVDVQWVGILSSLLQEQWHLALELAMLENLNFRLPFVKLESTKKAFFHHGCRIQFNENL